MLMIATPVSDPVFPTLDAALDAEAATAAFRSVLSARGFRFEALSASVERCRIKRGRKALIGYRLTGHAIDQQVMLTLFPDNDAAKLPALCAPTELTQPAFGPPTCAIADLGGKAWFFPNDRKIAHLAALVAGEGTEVVHYVPEQGCTVRRQMADGSVRYGKCRADDRGQIAAKVAAAAEGLLPALRLARTVSHDPERRILWQEGVAGRAITAAEIWRAPELWASRIAEALAAFQTIKAVDGMKQLTSASIAETIVRRIERMMAALPAQADQLNEFGAVWQAQAPIAQPLVLAHGDLHSGNLLWDGTSFALIDLDTAAHAPRAADFGTLTASLVHKATQANEPDALIDRLIGAFRASAEAVGCNAASFDWCLAGSLIGERLYRCTTRLKSPSLQVRERLLTIAERHA